MEDNPYPLGMICEAYGVYRQAFYQYQKRAINRRLNEEIILQLVQSIRNRQPRIGTRKLYYLIASQLSNLDIKIGRDGLFDLLRREGLLVRSKRSGRKTTNSSHPFFGYHNRIANLTLRRINEVFVSDITYLSTIEGFVYLALITDLYSRKIVGFDVSDSLCVSGALRALQMALAGVPKRYELIHHSDRGVQYCCHAYRDLLIDHQVAISCADTGDVYQNAVAERVNGILKIDFLLDQVFNSIDSALALTKESIDIYNCERPHQSLNYQTPQQVYHSSYVEWYH